MTTIDVHPVNIALGDWRTITCRACKLKNQELSASTLSVLETVRLRHRLVRAGEFLLDQGQSTPRVLTIYSGVAAAQHAASSGDRQLIDVLTSGDLVGVETLNGPARCSVQALTDLTICEHDPARLVKALTNSEVRDIVFRQLTHQLDRVTARLTSVAATSAKAALASFLLDVHGRLTADAPGGTLTFRLPLSVTQFGEALGLTAVHVHRLLRTLREQGLCLLENRRVTILDYRALAKVAGGSIETNPEIWAL